MEPCGPAVSIIVIEDEELTLEILASSLAAAYPGVTIHKALNGRAGLDLFVIHEPDIVITDLNMPGMGGIEMAGEIVALKPDTKLIVLTGDNSLEHPGGRTLKYDYLLKKPVDLVDLFAALDDCVSAIISQRTGPV